MGWGRPNLVYIVTQTIQRNDFTDFDRKLSRHPAATRGAGFPAFTVAVQVNERGRVGRSYSPSIRPTGR